jgi:hypothetical protein
MPLYADLLAREVVRHFQNYYHHPPALIANRQELRPNFYLKIVYWDRSNPHQ